MGQLFERREERKNGQQRQLAASMATGANGFGNNRMVNKRRRGEAKKKRSKKCKSKKKTNGKGRWYGFGIVMSIVIYFALFSLSVPE